MSNEGDQTRSERFADLRRRAEEAMRDQRIDLSELPAEEVQRLVHELRVRQIELEKENGELRQRVADLEGAKVAR